MDRYEIFFPQVAQAEHLRSIAAQMARANRRRGAPKELEQDLGALGLVGALVEKGVLTREELQDQLRRVDSIDGAADGSVSPEALRAALGYAPPDAGPPPAPVPRRRRSR